MYNSQDLNNRIQEYDEHNKQVIAYFKDKPSQLLVMNITEGDGWEKLCKFLNKPIPNKAFPHKNKAPIFSAASFKAVLLPV